MPGVLCRCRSSSSQRYRDDKQTPDDLRSIYSQHENTSSDEWRGLNQRRARLRKTRIIATLRYDFFMSFMFFMSHESPQQQHSCLSEESA